MLVASSHRPHSTAIARPPRISYTAHQVTLSITPGSSDRAFNHNLDHEQINRRRRVLEEERAEEEEEEGREEEEKIAEENIEKAYGRTVYRGIYRAIGGEAREEGGQFFYGNTKP